MKKMVLIHPMRGEGRSGYASSEVTHMPPLSLASVAAAMPEGWEIEIIDEYIHPATGVKADIVGMTIYSSNAPRAYHLAKELREQGMTVIMGGMHASLNADEVLLHADSVVVGEAESILKDLVLDYENGELKKKYVAQEVDMSLVLHPRRDLFSKSYSMDVMQTSRGCPFSCEFCSVTKVYGARYRQRPAEHVVAEYTALKKDLVYFVDDNIIGASKLEHERAIEIFKGIIKSGVKKIWFAQASINIADDSELLKYAHMAGCRMLYVGIESIDAANLKNVRKSVNMKGGRDGILERIHKIHSAGIGVIGSFIVGQDFDTVDSLQGLLKFMDDSCLDVLDLSYLTAYRGTKLFDRLVLDGRLLYTDYPHDWQYYDGDNLVVKPDKISIVDLVHGFDRIINARMNWRSIVLQIFKTWRSTGSVAAALLAYNFNKGQRASYLSRR